MFGIFKNKQPTVMDGLIRAIYGDHPPTKSADLERAVTIAHEDLLCEVMPLAEVRNVASSLFAGPMPYSTHDLAVAVALSFFKKPEHLNSLKDVQLAARLRVLNWMKDGKVARGVTEIFEDALYAAFKPGLPPKSQSGPPPIPRDPGSDQDAQFALFQERNAGGSLDDAAEIVNDFMLRQHNFAEDKKPDDWWDDPNQRDHAKRIERAFLFGAVRLTGEAFSFSPDDDDIFLAKVLDLFHGIDEEEKEVERIFEAIDVEEGAMWGGREAMIEYLLNERKDEDLRDLADQQKVCWSPGQPLTKQHVSSDEEAEFELFKKKNADKPMHEAAGIVKQFLVWQKNFAICDRPHERDMEQDEHARRIERAFLLGASGTAAEAFSISSAEDDLFLMNIIGTYRGFDEDEAEQEVVEVYKASDAEEKATRIGGAAMVNYLLNGKSEEHVVHLAALQKVCWNPVEIQGRGDVANGFRFTEAALRWVETWGVAFGGLKAACKAAGIEAEHTRAVNALSNVDTCIMKLMRVRDDGAMLEQEGRLMAATEEVVKTMEQLSEAAHVRRVDVSATAAIVKSLITILEMRGMLKQ
jgi:hypothetical protein